MKRFPFLDLRRINADYSQALRAAAAHAVDSGRYIGGQEVETFERNLAEYVGANSIAVGTGNGYDALFLILEGYKAMGRLNTGDEVIVPANTYIATVLAVVNAGLTPVFADPDPDTMTLTGDRTEAALTERTRAIMTVHLYGAPAWDAKMGRLATERNLIVIEDAAQSIGAVAFDAGLNGTTTAGSLGHAAAFSFYPTKNLGALGDGGAVVTTDPTLATTVRAIGNYGADTRNHHIYLGVNSRLDPIQAAMLDVKLKEIDAVNNRRRQRATLYGSLIDNPMVRTPYNPGSVWHQYVVRIADGRRDEFREYLDRNGVETDVHYPTPPHRQPCLSSFGVQRLPIAERLAREVVSLPISDCTPIDDVAEIASIINRFK